MRLWRSSDDEHSRLHIPYVFEFTGELYGGKLTKIPTVLLRHTLLINASEDGSFDSLMMAQIALDGLPGAKRSAKAKRPTGKTSFAKSSHAPPNGS